MNRLGEEERMEVESLIERIDNSGAEDRISAFAQFGALMEKADAYDPLACECGVIDELSEIDCQVEIFQGVWKDAAELRRSGKLLEFGKHIKCPVVAIHGDYDPHPAEGVRKPLTAVLENFRCIILENCGHKPWMEREARDIFFSILEEELH